MCDILVQADLPTALVDGIEARWPSSTVRAAPERIAKVMASGRPDVLVLLATGATGLRRVRAIRERKPLLPIALVVDADVSLHGSRSHLARDAVELIHVNEPTASLVERIEALARSSAPPRLRLERGTVDLATGAIQIDGRAGRLTGLELRLLAALARALDTPVEAGEILEEVWGYDPSTRTRALPAAIYRLRRKIDRSPPVHLVTDDRGRYRLRVTGAATTRLVVKTPAQGAGPSATSKARSGAPDFLIPAEMPAKRKPETPILLMAATLVSAQGRRRAGHPRP